MTRSYRKEWPFHGVYDFCDRDFHYRRLYKRRDQEQLRTAVSATYKRIYGRDYNGFGGRRGTSALGQFLGHMKDKLPVGIRLTPLHLSHKLTWTSLEYFFASQASTIGNERLSFDFKFYCASALAAADTLITECDRSDPPRVPYIFIATTQLPNEFITADAIHNEEDHDYTLAKKIYRDDFREKIAHRSDKSLIVERHIFATDTCDTIPYLKKQAEWALDSHRNQLNFDRADVANPFARWLKGNQCWRAGEYVLPQASAAFFNLITEDQLPRSETNEHVRPPRDQDMCIDLIVFGVAGIIDQSIEVDWKFGIGVFASARAENLEGRYVRLFSHSDLANEHNSFPFLGYKAHSFRSLFNALHNIGHQTADHYIGIKPSTLLVSQEPWCEWIQTAVTSDATAAAHPSIRFGNIELDYELDQLRRSWRKLLSETSRALHIREGLLVTFLFAILAAALVWLVTLAL